MVAGWRDQETTGYGTPKRWGTGINPVHYIIDNTGRDITPDAAKYPGPPPEITSESLQSFDQGVPSAGLWGAGEQTGTAELPPIGTPNTKNRANADGYPSWAQNGRSIRAQVKGSKLAILAKQIFSVEPYEGLKGKETGPENQPVVSSPTQYEITTSMAQRNNSRNGTQNPGGRASKYVQTIGSRYAGMRQPQIDGANGNSERHGAMLPKAQETMVRGWWARTAGTGPVAWMESNSMYVSEAMTREAPPQPSTGPTVTYDGDYLDGDQVWW